MQKLDNQIHSEQRKENIILNFIFITNPGRNNKELPESRVLLKFSTYYLLSPSTYHPLIHNLE